MFFRAADANNGYMFRASGVDGSNLARLYKRQNGTWTSLTTGAITPPAANTWYTVKVEVNGANISGYLNGALVLSYTDATFSSGKVGFRTTNYEGTNHHHFDDVTVNGRSIAYYHYDGNNIISETDENNAPKATFDYVGGYQPSSFSRYTFTDSFSTDLSKWQLPSANWTIESGELSANTPGDEIILSNQSFTDFTYQAQINSKTGVDVGLFFRAQDTNNGYLFRATNIDGSYANGRIPGTPYLIIDQTSFLLLTPSLAHLLTS